VLTPSPGKRRGETLSIDEFAKLARATADHLR